jgi:hypothetical protein
MLTIMQANASALIDQVLNMIEISIRPSKLSALHI